MESSESTSNEDGEQRDYYKEHNFEQPDPTASASEYAGVNETLADRSTDSESPAVQLREIRDRLERLRKDVNGDARVNLTAAIASVQAARLQEANHSEQGYVHGTAGPSGAAHPRAGGSHGGGA